MHNLVLAAIMGILFSPAAKTGQTVVCLQLFGRTLILPFLFNAILLLNSELSDPFKGGVGDFPQAAYVNALDKDVRALLTSTQNAPPWLAKRMLNPDARARSKEVSIPAE